MKNVNLILTTISTAMSAALAIIFTMSGNIPAAGGWGIATIWSANTLLYQLRDK